MAIYNIGLKYVHDELKSLIYDLRHSGSTTALYRLIAVSMKDGLKWYIIVNTSQGQG